eukprot:308869-Pelagomonas_calceolata.AAC.2
MAFGAVWSLLVYRRAYVRAPEAPSGAAHHRTSKQAFWCCVEPSCAPESVHARTRGSSVACHCQAPSWLTDHSL